MDMIHTKFIMNVDNKRFIYTEKIVGRNEAYFNIYDGETFHKCNQDIYYSIFGTNEKISILDFIRYANDDILSGINFNERMLPVCKQLEYVYNGIKNKNIKNPSLWGSKATLLSAINNYNKILEERPKEELTYDYEKDYIRVKDE